MPRETNGDYPPGAIDDRLLDAARAAAEAASAQWLERYATVIAAMHMDWCNEIDHAFRRVAGISCSFENRPECGIRDLLCELHGMAFGDVTTTLRRLREIAK